MFDNLSLFQKWVIKITLTLDNCKKLHPLCYYLTQTLSTVAPKLQSTTSWSVNKIIIKIKDNSAIIRVPILLITKKVMNH